MVGGAVGFTFLSGTIDSLYFTQQPLNTVAGASISSTGGSLQLTAFSPTTNGIDTSFHGVVTIGILENGTLLGTTTATAVNGVATFTGLSIDQVGVYEFTAGSSTTNPAYSNAFNITPAVATHFVIAEQPSSMWEFNRMTVPVVVNLEDQFGNLVTDDTATVTLKINSGPAGAVLSGGTTAKANNGQAVFIGVAANLPGTYTLVVSSPSVTDAITGAFAVVPAPVTETHLFNGARLSSSAILFQQVRNSGTFSGAPSAAQVDALVSGNNITPAFASAPVVMQAPASTSSAFAASSVTPTAASSSSTLLDSTSVDSTDKKLLN
jgi:hypothetical protein